MHNAKKHALHDFHPHHIPAVKKSHASITIMKGFVEGFGASTPKDECVDGVESVADDVDTAIIDFEKRTTEGMIEAITTLAQAFEMALPRAMDKCDDTKSELKEILKALDDFKTAKDLIYHIGEDLVLG